MLHLKKRNIKNNNNDFTESKQVMGELQEETNTRFGLKGWYSASILFKVITVLFAVFIIEEYINPLMDYLPRLRSLSPIERFWIGAGVVIVIEMFIHFSIVIVYKTKVKAAKWLGTTGALSAIVLVGLLSHQSVELLSQKKRVRFARHNASIQQAKDELNKIRSTKETSVNQITQEAEKLKKILLSKELTVDQEKGKYTNFGIYTKIYKSKQNMKAIGLIFKIKTQIDSTFAAKKQYIENQYRLPLSQAQAKLTKVQTNQSTFLQKTKKNFTWLSYIWVFFSLVTSLIVCVSEVLLFKKNGKESKSKIITEAEEQEELMVPEPDLDDLDNFSDINRPSTIGEVPDNDNSHKVKINTYEVPCDNIHKEKLSIPEQSLDRAEQNEGLSIIFLRKDQTAIAKVSMQELKEEDQQRRISICEKLFVEKKSIRDVSKELKTTYYSIQKFRADIVQNDIEESAFRDCVAVKVVDNEL